MKYLLIGPAWVGDMIMSQVVPLLLTQQHASVEIHLAAPASTLPIAQRMPQITATHLLPFGRGKLEFKARLQWAQQQKALGFDRAIVLPNTWKSALLVQGIAQRTGWRGEWRYGLLNDCRILREADYPLMVQRYAALAYAAGDLLPEQLPKPALAVDLVAQARLAEQWGYRPSRSLVVLCPGAEFGAAKRWPIEYFAALAQQLLYDGHQVWVMGSVKEQVLAAQITAQLSAPEGYRDLTGRTSLLEAIDLLALANAVISNDSGLLHMAAALNRPSVAIYGSTPSSLAPPLMAASRVQILEKNLSCQPCLQRTCPLQHLNCLREIMPQQVHQALQQLILQQN